MRVIRKSASASTREVVDLLSSLFAAELMKPSLCVWVVSPWVSDIPLIDNRVGNFPSLDRFGRRMITLSELLVALAGQSVTVVVATRTDELNEAFLARLHRFSAQHGVAESIRVVETPSGQRAHDKSLCGDDFVVSGSMNLTFAGTFLNEEQVELHTDQRIVA